MWILGESRAAPQWRRLGDGGNGDEELWPKSQGWEDAGGEEEVDYQAWFLGL